MDHVKNTVEIRDDGTAAFRDALSAETFLAEIRSASEQIMRELLAASETRAGEIMVVGCSSSEVTGNRIGKASVPAVADAILDGILPLLQERGVYLAAQCCEHLNRALIVDRSCAREYGLEPVWVRPAPKAGGSFAASFYNRLEDPVAVETIRAHAGLDIGGTLIGMHLRQVAVPLRLSVKRMGEAPILCATTRPKYIGGPRAIYE
ncbi:MAG: TIGR01440 family protein [Clostridia bacterium]|nr:TIGR01440 family protein [Clostridia bacterium]